MSERARQPGDWALPAFDIDREKAQRALHRLPGWEESIVFVREQLSYDVGWWNVTDLDWNGLTPMPPIQCWVRDHRNDLSNAMTSILIGLGLPESFAQYWKACFYSYQPGDLASVMEDGPMVGHLNLQRAYPPSHGITITIDDMRTLTITGPVALVTRDALVKAAERAWTTVRSFNEQFPHPLTAIRRSLPAVEARQATRDDMAERVAQLRARPEDGGDGLTQSQTAARLGIKIGRVQSIERSQRRQGRS